MVTSKLTGRAAVILAIFAIVPGFVPGAVSIFGLALSMLALVLSLFSVRQNGPKYTWITVVITTAGILLANDVLRVWSPVPMPVDLRLGLYALVLLVAIACILVAHTLKLDRGLSADRLK